MPDYLVYDFTTAGNTELYSLAAMEWFWTAFRKRYGAANSIGGTLPGIPDATSNVQGCTSLTAYSGADNHFPLSRIQYWLEHNAGSFIDPGTLAALPSTTRPAGWTWATLAAAAGLNGGKGDGWRRLKQREITSLSATEDEDGNTIADGMVARLIVSPHGDYRYTSGTWVKLPSVTTDAADLPDVLDSAVVDEDGGFYCTPGVSYRENDLIGGGWIQNEVRDVFLLTQVTRDLPFGVTDCGAPDYAVELRFGSGHSGTDTTDGTLAAAKGYAEDGWDNAPRFGTYSNSVGTYEGAFGGWTQWSTIDAFESFSLTSRHAQPSWGTDQYDAVLHGSRAFYHANRFRSLAGLQADVDLVVKAASTGFVSIIGGGITSTTFDNNGIGGTDGQYVVLQTKEVTTTNAGGDPAWYFDVVGDLTTKPTWDATALADGDIALRGAHYTFEAYFHWDFGAHGTYTLAGSDAAAELADDCPVDRCWYLMEYSASCTNTARPDITKAQWTETQIGKTCGPHQDSTLVEAGTNGEGFTKYRRWVPADECPGGSGDCPDLSPRVLAAAEAVAIGLPIVGCPVLTKQCYRPLIVTYDEEFAWAGEEGLSWGWGDPVCSDGTDLPGTEWSLYDDPNPCSPRYVKYYPMGVGCDVATDCPDEFPTGGPQYDNDTPLEPTYWPGFTPSTPCNS